MQMPQKSVIERLLEAVQLGCNLLASIRVSLVAVGRNDLVDLHQLFAGGCRQIQEEDLFLADLAPARCLVVKDNLSDVKTHFIGGPNRLGQPLGHVG